MRLTAYSNNVTVQIIKNGQPSANIQYKYADSPNWNNYNYAQVLNINGIGNYIEFQNTSQILSQDKTNYFQFKLTGDVAASNSIQSLLNYSENLSPYCFYSLFKFCTSLITAPELPAQTLVSGCYENMFARLY